MEKMRYILKIWSKQVQCIVCTKQRKKKAIHEQQKIKMQLITMLDYVYSSCHKKQIHLIVFFLVDSQKKG